VNSGGGQINFTGTAINTTNANAVQGIDIQVGSSIDSGGGNINFTGTGTNDAGIVIRSPINSGNGNVTLTADIINLAPGNGSPSVTSNSNLLLQPLTPSVPLEIGGAGDATTTFLNQAELNNLSGNSITVGRIDSSGAITLANDLTFNAPVTLRSPFGTGSINTQGFNINGTGSVTLQAGDSIILGTNSQISPVAGSLDVTLNSDADSSGAGAIALNSGAVINSDGGNIILGGGNDPLNNPAQGTATNPVGIALEGANINSGSGNISIQGTGIDSGSLAHGISLLNGATVESTGTGTISLNGTGGSGTESNRGISIVDSSSISSENGNINLTGTGGDGTGASNVGIFLDNGSVVESTGAGTVSLVGIGGNGTSENRGIELQGNQSPGINTSIVRSGDGNINLMGTGNGTESFNIGIFLNNGGVVESTGTGNITLDGTGVNGAEGIRLEDDSSITGNGTVTLTANEINLLLLQGTVSPQIRATGGTIILESSGDINTTAGTLDSSAVAGDGGTISLEASGDITTGDIVSSSNGTIGNGGEIEITSGGTIDTSSGSLDSSAASGSGGAVALNAAGDIISTEIDSSSQGSGQGGAIALDSGGTIDTSAGPLNASSVGGDGGAIALEASGNITTGDIVSSSNGTTGNGGEIEITSGGTIDTSSGSLDSSAASGSGGAVALNAAGDIISTEIDSSSQGSGQGGAIALNSGGTIETSDLTSSGAGGGDITIDASTVITTGEINSSGSVGDGGNVTLDPSGDVQVTSIDAQGGDSGRGGTVDITTERFFRATGAFTDRNGVTASISTAGGQGGGDITIRHGGGGVIPFEVGDATTNGTAAAITSGDFTISPFASFPFTFIKGNIEIVSVPSPNIDTVLPPPPYYQFPPIQQLPPLVVQIDPFSLLYLEQRFTKQFEKYLGLSDTPIKTLNEAQQTLRQVEEATGVKPALIYVAFLPPNILSVEQLDFPLQPDDRLALVLVTAEGKPIWLPIPGATRRQVITEVEQFQSALTKIAPPSSYLNQAQQLYQWLVAPLEEQLKAKGIDNLVFLMDTQLRSLPLAALHDGQKFLVEKYSVGLMPSLSLTDTRYVDVKNLKVLAMGAETFPNEKPLPAAPEELKIVTQLWASPQPLLNQSFTADNLKQSRSSAPFGMIHLATHANFQAGDLRNSYINFWDSKLRLDQVRQLGLNDPPLELLVLSACNTALGNSDAELGFAGLAAKAAVKSAMGSLWYVSDEGTLGLMASFYGQLKRAPIKAEALRQAQVAMIEGKARLENGQLVTEIGNFPLSPDLAGLGNRNLSHPYYWSGFTIIGSPW
jgi:CHAT domain-containing protein